MDFGQFISDTWKLLLLGFCAVVGIQHRKQNEKISLIEGGKVDKFFYKKDRELLESKVENKLDRIEFHIKLLCEKNGIHYEENTHSSPSAKHRVWGGCE